MAASFASACRCTGTLPREECFVPLHEALHAATSRMAAFLHACAAGLVAGNGTPSEGASPASAEGEGEAIARAFAKVIEGAEDRLAKLLPSAVATELLAASAAVRALQ